MYAVILMHTAQEAPRAVLELSQEKLSVHLPGLIQGLPRATSVDVREIF